MHTKKTLKRRKPARPKPVLMTFSLDGGPGEPDCCCPICAENALSGEPMYTIDAAGEMVKLPPRPIPEMMAVTVRGTISTWPHLPPEPRTVTIPAGCIVHALLEYLCFKDPALRLAFLPGMLGASIAGEPCEPNRMLRPGDRVTVFAAEYPGFDR